MHNAAERLMVASRLCIPNQRTKESRTRDRGIAGVTLALLVEEQSCLQMTAYKLHVFAIDTLIVEK